MRMRTRLVILLAPAALVAAMIAGSALLACGCADVHLSPIDRSQVPPDVDEAAVKAKPGVDFSRVEKQVLAKTKVLNYRFHGEDASGASWVVVVTPELAVGVSRVSEEEPILRPVTAGRGEGQP